jgi:hypothetical protein
MAEGPFSENGNPNFFSSAGEEWRILGEVFTACLLFLTRMSPFSEKATKGCHTFLHGEAILLAPLFPHSPFSDLRECVTTPIVRDVETEKGARYKCHGETHPLFMRHGWYPNEHA